MVAHGLDARQRQRFLAYTDHMPKEIVPFYIRDFVVNHRCFRPTESFLQNLVAPVRQNTQDKKALPVGETNPTQLINIATRQNDVR